MKLLSKTDITKLKTTERQQSVEEGLKLAKRVDALRQTVAEEDANLQKYRTQTLTEIHLQIIEETTKRDSLKAEVKKLKADRTVALEPLDVIKDELQQKELNLKATEEMIKALDAELNKKELAIAGRERDVVAQEKRAKVIYNSAQDLLTEASTLKEEAKNKNQQANNLLVKTINNSEAQLQTIKEKEGYLDTREKAIFKKEEELRKKEIDLAKELSRLKDRQETFIRTKNRK